MGESSAWRWHAAEEFALHCREMHGVSVPVLAGGQADAARCLLAAGMTTQMQC
jgi:hypothetical protein